MDFVVDRCVRERCNGGRSQGVAVGRHRMGRRSVGAAAVLALLFGLSPVGPTAAEPVGNGLRGRTPVWVWGYGNRGALGLGTTAVVRQPTPAALPARTAKVAAGVGFGVALTSSGRIYTWGDARYGQLGTGSTASVLGPAVRVELPGGRRASDVDAAGSHVVVAATDGSVWTWGRNASGELGDGSRTDRLRPRRVSLPRGARASAVAAGADHSVVVTTSGAVYGWGRNATGQLGRAPGGDRLSPTAIAMPRRGKAKDVAGGGSHTLVLLRDGRVVSIGAMSGTVGSLQPTAATTTPKVVALPAKIAAVDAGTGHSMALTQDGRLYAWGDNSLAQLGDGTRIDRSTPVRVPVAGPIRQVSTAGQHTLILDRGNRVWSWGDNRHGQNGNGTVATVTKPARVARLASVKVTTVTTGEYLSIVLATSPPKPPPPKPTPTPTKKPKPPKPTHSAAPAGWNGPDVTGYLANTGAPNGLLPMLGVGLLALAAGGVALANSRTSRRSGGVASSAESTTHDGTRGGDR